jgi:hypothetical protein
MQNITDTQRTKISSITETVIHRLLTFHVSYSSLQYIHDKASKNWRDLEEELHNDYQIKGIGVKATRENLKIINENDGGFMHLEEDLYPGEVPAELDSFPYKEASAAYVFTILEGYGDDIVGIVNPDYLKKRQAWHHGVYGDADLTNSETLTKAISGFAKPFKVNAEDIPLYAVQRLTAVKAVRNEFIHEGSASVDFNLFFASVIGTVAFIYFSVLPSALELSVYPYEDYSGKWQKC